MNFIRSVSVQPEKGLLSEAHSLENAVEVENDEQ